MLARRDSKSQVAAGAQSTTAVKSPNTFVTLQKIPGMPVGLLMSDTSDGPRIEMLKGIAAASDLRVGDVLISVNGVKPMSRQDAVQRIVDGCPKDGLVNLGVFREPVAAVPHFHFHHPAPAPVLLGSGTTACKSANTFVTLQKIPQTPLGLVMHDTSNGTRIQLLKGIAAASDLRVDDFIMSVNGVNITSQEDAVKHIRAAESRVELGVFREGVASSFEAEKDAFAAEKAKFEAEKAAFEAAQARAALAAEKAKFEAEKAAFEARMRKLAADAEA